MEKAITAKIDKKKDYHQCKSCFMDTSDPDISFNEQGNCNYCELFDSEIQKYRFIDEKPGLIKLRDLIKQKASSSEYDAALGISGGVDSSFLALLAKRLDLKLMLVHCDNGWNSNIAVSNIEKLVSYTGFELYTHVLDWLEFSEIQRSFIKAGVIDIEMITDHANRAVMYDVAKKYKINAVLSGENFVTEHGLPSGWTWNKRDIINIKDIHLKISGKKVKKLPVLSTFKERLYSEFGVGFRYFKPLNEMNYSKTRAMRELEKEVGWEYYGGKHYESIFTKFYQSYILPTKFGIDKRRAHYSDIMRNGEITYSNVRKIIMRSPFDYPEFQNEYAFVLNKLRFSKEEFDYIMREAPVSHRHYKTDEIYIELLKPIYRRFFKR